MEGEENQWEGSQERERPVTLGERAEQEIFTPPPSNYRVHTAASITRSSARLLFTAARQRPRRRQLVKEEIHHRTQVNPPEAPTPHPHPPPVVNLLR